MYREQHGFSGPLRRLAALPSLPGVSPAASVALPATKSAPEKLRRTCQREKIGAGKKEDAGGLTPAKDDDAASVDFSRWQAYCSLYTEGIILVRFVPEQHWKEERPWMHGLSAYSTPASAA